MGAAFAANAWAVLQGASDAAIPAARPPASHRLSRPPPRRSCPSKQRRKTAQALAALRVALKRGRGLRWILSHSPLRGCSFESALPAASFECNKGHPHLISGSLTSLELPA